MAAVHRERGDESVYPPATVKCEKCGSAITVRKADDGKTVACPKCRATYDVVLNEVMEYRGTKQRGSHFEPVLTLRHPGKA
jgi:DNA-directed RNA polymerase subunit M/transcription elongation factor TFIIS